MRSLGWASLYLASAAAVTCIATAALANTADDRAGLTVDRLNCIASDVALTHGFESMAGKTVKGEDGTVYSYGKSERTVAYVLTPAEEETVAPLVARLTPGAIHYVDGYLFEPGFGGRDGARPMTKDAEAFIEFYMKCLNAFGADMTP